MQKTCGEIISKEWPTCSVHLEKKKGLEFNLDIVVIFAPS